MAKKSSRYKKGVRYFLLLFVAVISFVTTAAVIKANQTQPTCANSLSCTSDLSVKIENSAKGVFLGRTVIPPSIDTKVETATLPVLGASTVSGEKHIYIDLSKQTLYAYQGITQIFKTFISSGKWRKTPVGNFHIWEKLVATRMAGGEGADAYDLPNVPYVMYFYRDFGLHGAYWHNNFGHPMSHGCVNMRIVDAKTMYDWVDAPSGQTLGTAVSVCDEITPSHQCIQNNPVL